MWSQWKMLPVEDGALHYLDGFGTILVVCQVAMRQR